MRILISHIFCALLFFVNLTPQAYCVTAKGLVIDLLSNIKEIKNSDEQKRISNLTEIAIPNDASQGQIDNAVEYTILDDSTSFYDSDTDDEPSFSEDGRNAREAYRGIDNLSSARRIQKYRYNRSRNMPRCDEAAYEPRRNYLKTELQSNKLRVQLSKDTFDIVSSESNSRTQDSTVCFCVALRDKDGYVKKFSFHNGTNVMSPAMRTKAHELGYDVIQAEQSHAEGQFLQFLLHRHRKRPGLYPHIMGMGCSKCHCAECNHILKACLGSNYHAVTASVYDKKNESDGPKVGSISATSAPSGLDEVDNSDDDVACTQNRAQAIRYKLVKGTKTIDTASYDSMYLPEILQEFLSSITGISYDFSDNRLTKSTKQKTRKRSGSAPKPVG